MFFCWCGESRLAVGHWMLDVGCLLKSSGCGGCTAVASQAEDGRAPQRRSVVVLIGEMLFHFVVIQKAARDRLELTLKSHNPASYLSS
jgi:hypothetical protein